jgi:hypothetical protein
MKFFFNQVGPFCSAALVPFCLTVYTFYVAVSGPFLLDRSQMYQMLFFTLN